MGENNVERQNEVKLQNAVCGGKSMDRNKHDRIIRSIADELVELRRIRTEVIRLSAEACEVAYKRQWPEKDRRTALALDFVGVLDKHIESLCITIELSKPIPLRQEG